MKEWDALYKDMQVVLEKHGNNEIIIAGALGWLVSEACLIWGPEETIEKLEFMIGKMRQKYNVPRH